MYFISLDYSCAVVFSIIYLNTIIVEVENELPTLKKEVHVNYHRTKLVFTMSFCLLNIK